ncbi:DUF2256 domain-containing protein [Methylibium sp.]|uniref:DUF2256 domain-containing protein n=1 Tax=Methylibium sp. TaxID=2067992 RepID=UPI00286C4C7E|nr:DUF2256 domain-containing protein [Methylibium sp.]
MRPSPLGTRGAWARGLPHERAWRIRVDSSRGQHAVVAEQALRVCGRTMTWRRRWARHWDEVRYCSAACRKLRSPDG